MTDDGHPDNIGIALNDLAMDKVYSGPADREADLTEPTWPEHAAMILVACGLLWVLIAYAIGWSL